MKNNIVALAVLALAGPAMLAQNPAPAQGASSGNATVQSGAQAGAGSSASAGTAGQRNDRAVSGSAQGGASMNTQAGATGGSAGISSDTAIDAELTKSIDARKAKVGDEVTARVRNDVRQGGEVVLKRGTKLVGHVTQAQAKASGAANSQLGIIFDRAEVKGSQAIDIHAAIQALAPPPRTNADDSGMGDVGSMRAGQSIAGPGAGSGGGASAGGMGGVGSTVGETAGGVAQGAGNAAGAAGRGAGRVAAGAGGALGASSRGVMGMPGLQISSELSNSTNGTVLVSDGKDIHLDSGTQMVLRVVGSGGTRP